MNSFEDLFISHTDRYSSKWQHYFEIYDRHLAHLKNKELVLLEIGVSQGGSLQLWKKYFGTQIKIYGIDVNPESKFSEPQIEVFIGDQTDVEFLDCVIKNIGPPTVIIDDGSHIQSHVIKTFEFLFPKLVNNGIYIIEDCHTSYWPRFEGGLNSHLNVVDIMSRTAHDVNTKWYNEPRTPKIKQLNSIHFYDSVIVLEKRPKQFTRRMVDVDVNGARIMESI